MQNVKFKFELSASGSLANVLLFAEDSTMSVYLEESDGGKSWRNNSFELEVANPFNYKLIVYGMTGTKWSAKLVLITKSGDMEFLKWEGKTGDNGRNTSVRMEPTRNLPS